MSYIHMLCILFYFIFYHLSRSCILPIQMGSRIKLNHPKSWFKHIHLRVRDHRENRSEFECFQTCNQLLFFVFWFDSFLGGGGLHWLAWGYSCIPLKWPVICLESWSKKNSCFSNSTSSSLTNGRSTITHENEVIRLEREAWNLVQYFCRDGEEEMMRNARCFVIFYSL